MGASISVGRLGTVLAGWILPHSWGIIIFGLDASFLPLFICTLVCLFSLFCNIVANIIDKWADKIENLILAQELEKAESYSKHAQNEDYYIISQKLNNSK